MNEYIRGGYAIIPFSTDAADMHARFASAYHYGKAVLLTRFIRAGVLYPDQFVTVKENNGSYEIDIVDVAHITVSSVAVTVTDSTVGTTYTAGDGISIENGVISVSYPDADTEEW